MRAAFRFVMWALVLLVAVTFLLRWFGSTVTRVSSLGGSSTIETVRRFPAPIPPTTRPGEKPRPTSAVTVRDDPPARPTTTTTATTRPTATATATTSTTMRVYRILPRPDLVAPR